MTGLTRESVLLVAGGARGITARCVVQLAAAYHCSFVLVGRSLRAEEPAWADGTTDSAQLMRRIAEDMTARGERPTPPVIRKQLDRLLAAREIATTLAEVTAAGGRAEYIAADVTDPAALATALRGATLGPISGIIHGAGVLADKLIDQKSAADYDAVFAAKIGGLRSLLAVVPAAHLQTLVLFSSAAGFYGNIGQSDYAMANEMLNRFAHAFQRQHPHCRVVALDWGPWDGGMVTPALRELFASRNVRVIPVAAGAATLVDELAPGRTDVQVLVGDPMPAPPPDPLAQPLSQQIRRRLSLDTNPLLADHMVGIHAVLPAMLAASWCAEGAAQSAPGWSVLAVEKLVVHSGIVFDAAPVGDFTLDLRETAREAGVIHAEARISGGLDGTPARPRYRAEIVLATQRAAAPQHAIDTAERQPFDGAQLYDEGALFHGPQFQGITRVLRIDDAGLVMHCQVPEVTAEARGQFGGRALDGLLADVLYQGLVAWVRRVRGVASLPLAVARITLYDARADGQLLAQVTVRENTPTKTVADIIATNRAGQVVMELVGAEVTLSPRLNELFARRALEIR